MSPNAGGGGGGGAGGFGGTNPIFTAQKITPKKIWI
jgi:hypothetical protein